jgi:hypothetical protein
MAHFSKETLKFLSAVGGDTKKILAPIPTSADRMIPGNVLIFRYEPLAGGFYRTMMGRFITNQRVILIIKCKRGDGVFPGKTGKLVSCFKLDRKSDVVVDAILSNLYKKRRRASYYGLIKDSLIKLLGRNSFRTYRLRGMKDIYKLSLGDQKVRFD